MAKKLLLIVAVLILAVLNFSVWEKEAFKKTADLVYLELAPVDPRSLMQGDYMRLNLNVDQELRTEAHENLRDQLGKPKALVFKVNDQNIGTFIRHYAGEDLAEAEYLYPYDGQRFSISLRPTSFFFQEGHASYFDVATYGVYRFTPDGERLLIGLAKDDLKIIDPVQLEKAKESKE